MSIKTSAGMSCAEALEARRSSASKGRSTRAMLYTCWASKWRSSVGSTPWRDGQSVRSRRSFAILLQPLELPTEPSIVVRAEISRAGASRAAGTSSCSGIDTTISSTRWVNALDRKPRANEPHTGELLEPENGTSGGRAWWNGRKCL